MNRFRVFLGFVIACCLWSTSLEAQTAEIDCPAPLSKARLVEFVKSGVPEKRIADFIQACGVDFATDDSTATYLMSQGLPQSAITILKAQQSSLSRADAQLSVEIEVWQKARGSENVELVQNYLKRYPDGLFAVPAAKRLRVLNGEEGRGSALDVKEESFSVYHQHGWSWCMGKLTIRKDSMTFESRKHKLEFTKANLKRAFSCEVAWTPDPFACFSVYSGGKLKYESFRRVEDADLQDYKPRNFPSSDVLIKRILINWGDQPW